MYESINSIINYWIDILHDGDKEHNNIYSFIPLSYSSFSKEDFYIIDARPFIKNDFVKHYDNCCFVKRNDIKYALTDEFCFIKYNKETYSTAQFLWENHSNSHRYYLAWLYVLCTYIIKNKDRIPMCENSVFYDHISSLLSYIKKQDGNNSPFNLKEYPQHKDSSKVLPDGLLITDFYKLSDMSNDNMSIQIAKILLVEILYILNNYYLIVY